MSRAIILSVAMAAGCGKVNTVSHDARVADAAVDALDAAPDALLPFVSCKQLATQHPTATSGLYTIDPDGPAGTGAPFMAYCDMRMDGGGWTLAMTLAIDPTGLTWATMPPGMTPPQSPTVSNASVLHYSTLAPMGVSQMMLMGGDRILKFFYPRTGVDFTNNYRDITERSAFRIENVPADAPHTGGSRDTCGHLADACTTTDFAAFKAADASCPRDATNSHTVTGCNGNCGSWGNCPGNGTTPPTPTPNCWFSGGMNAVSVPVISTCPAGSQAPWGNYTVGTLSGMYTLWVR